MFASMYMLTIGTLLASLPMWPFALTCMWYFSWFSIGVMIAVTVIATPIFLIGMLMIATFIAVMFKEGTIISIFINGAITLFCAIWAVAALLFLSAAPEILLNTYYIREFAWGVFLVYGMGAVLSYLLPIIADYFYFHWKNHS